MSETKNWLCTLCHRSGDETTMADAELRHKHLLTLTAWNREIMEQVYKGWAGPSSVCVGHIVMSEAGVKEKRRKDVQGTFVDEAGDTWVEMGARMKVSGKVEER